MRMLCPWIAGGPNYLPGCEQLTTVISKESPHVINAIIADPCNLLLSSYVATLITVLLVVHFLVAASTRCLLLRDWSLPR